ncbi:hypothetical protein QCA50_004930 [Cerrena zonata]|uniref:Peptidase C15, pyroglutamyl peptidase I-like protein n=1 Tax=Cerrena zonata TaxID=2478898 RepID=A0AAW0GPU8_9APHY
MPSTSNHEGRVLQVLITGFGAFRNYEDNPSWLAVRGLHGARLDLSTTPEFNPGPESSNPVSTSGAAVAHIQCIQVPVHYGSILDIVPRLHGSKKPYSPHAEKWFDERCDDTGLAGEEGKHYPNGYRIEHPEDGFDVIIHVGVGKTGALRVETLGHKVGYKHEDAREDLAPEVIQANIAADSDTNGKGLSDDYSQIEYDPSVANEELFKDGKLRGFGEGYEAFHLEERTTVNVPDIVERLKQQGMGGNVCQSENAGRYLCDFIFYCSLCEAKRRSKQGVKKASVLFLHVPPIDKDLSTESCTSAIRCIAWYLATAQTS